MNLGVAVHAPASGVAPGGTLSGFLLEGNFGSPVVVGLSDGSVLFGETNEPITVGQSGSTPEPATLALVAAGMAGLVRYRRRT